MAAIVAMILGLEEGQSWQHPTTPAHWVALPLAPCTCTLGAEDPALSISWELVRNAGSQASPWTSKSTTLGGELAWGPLKSCHVGMQSLVRCRGVGTHYYTAAPTRILTKCQCGSQPHIPYLV